jgi:hypothetical protein
MRKARRERKPQISLHMKILMKLILRHCNQLPAARSGKCDTTSLSKRSSNLPRMATREAEMSPLLIN